MKFTIVKKGLFLVLVPLFFQLGFIELAARMQREHTRTADVENHSKAVLAQGAVVLRTLIDAETGVLGFAITGNRSFTQAFDRATEELPIALARVRFLVH